MYASSFDVHDRFCQQDCVHFGTAVWMRSLPMVRLAAAELKQSPPCLLAVALNTGPPSSAMQGCGCARWPCYKLFCRNSIAVCKPQL